MKEFGPPGGGGGVPGAPLDPPMHSIHQLTDIDCSLYPLCNMSFACKQILIGENYLSYAINLKPEDKTAPPTTETLLFHPLSVLYVNF